MAAPKHEPETSAPSESTGAVWQVRLALVVLVLISVGPIVQDLNAQSGSRYALTAALVEKNTLRIDDYRAGTLPIDRVEGEDGALYSDKAPGQPFYAVPFLAGAQAVGAEPATTRRITGDLGLWWITLWSAVVPMAALVLLMYEAARRFYPGTAVQAAVALWAGTLWLVLAGNLYGHALATLLAFCAWLVIADREPNAARALLAGLLVGLSVLTEYPMALIALILAGYLLLRGHVRLLPWYVLGGLPPAVALLAYQTIVFGGPFETSYAAKAGGGGTGPEPGLPDPVTLFQIVAGTRGLLFTAIVLVGVISAVVMIRDRLPGREHAWMALVVFGAFLTLQSAWPNPWGGEAPGPRYLMAALPWLVVPVALAWERRRTICRVVTAIGAGFMTLATVTEHVIPHGWSLLTWYPKVVREEGLNPTLFTMAMGRVGWVLHLLLLGAAIIFLVRSVRRLNLSEAT